MGRIINIIISLFVFSWIFYSFCKESGGDMIIIVYSIMFGIFHSLSILIIGKLFAKKIDFTLIGIILILIVFYIIIVSYFGIHIRNLI